jgi:twitching motility protein PilT
MKNAGYEITDLLRLAVSEGADRLSLYVGQPPVIHVRGEEHAVEGPAITFENVMSLLRQLADTRQMREIHNRGVVGFVYTVPRKAKFRVQARLVREELQIELHRVAA